MVSFKPCNETGGGAFYTARNENGDELGSCSFEYAGFEMRFTSVSCYDDMIREGLARSAMNYCANRGAYVCYLGADMLSPAFIRLGFTKDNLTVEIPDALASTCCACKEKGDTDD